MTTQLENDLRATLAARAGQVPTSPDPYQSTHHRIVRSRRRRAAVSVVVAASLVIGVPTGLYALRPGAGNVSASDRSVLHWPIRGSLAGDRSFLTAAAERGQAESDKLEPPVRGTAHVLYAGDDGRHRAALVLVVGAKDTAGIVLSGPSKAPAGSLRVNSLLDGGLTSGRPIMSFDPVDKVLLVVGPPTMTEVEMSPALAFGPSGSPARVKRLIPADRGVVFADVPDGEAAQMWARGKVGGRFTESEQPSYSETPSEDAGPSDAAITSATRKAAGHIPEDLASELVQATAINLGVADSELTYRFWWGGPVGPNRFAIVATVSAPGIPTFRMVDTTVDQPKHPNFWQNYLLVTPVKGFAPPSPIGWTIDDKAAPRGDAVPPEDAVYAPGMQGDVVELLNHGIVIATAHLNGSGVATFPLNQTPAQLRSDQYQILDAHGTRTGDFALEDLDAIGQTITW
jgi:hypothetical protein